MATSAPKRFQLVAGHAALDLVNTLDNRFDPAHLEELLTSYEDILHFTEQSELLTERQARKLRRSATTPAQRTQILTQVMELRESLASALYAIVDSKPIPDPALQHLEQAFKAAAVHRKLTAGPISFEWNWKGLSRDLASPLWLLAQSANDLLTSPEMTQLRTCDAPTCRWLFLDTSKNHSRRWCDMKVCGNRNKARQFQSRQASE